MNTPEITQKITKAFPLLADDSLHYLDTAASALVPQAVTGAVAEYYTAYPANIARGVYELSERATKAYEDARTTVADFIGAQTDEIVFTSGATMSLNLLAHSLCTNLSRRDHVAVTAMDHHANFVPWQQAAQRTGAQFDVLPVSPKGTLSEDIVKKHITRNTRILALPLVSNVLGSVVDVAAVARAARSISPDILIIVDAAQGVVHLPVDVVTLECDALVFSGHKFYGPTGIGVLWARRTLLAQISPFLTGGEMVAAVSAEVTHFKDAPHKFEAGTPHIAGAIGLAAAIRWIQSIGGMKALVAHDMELTTYALTQLRSALGDTLTVYGPQGAHDRSGLISFSIDGIHPHDLAWYLDQHHGVAIRAGQHCTMPLHDALGVAATARASFGAYTTRADIDALVAGIRAAKDAMQK